MWISQYLPGARVHGCYNYSLGTLAHPLPAGGGGPGSGMPQRAGAGGRASARYRPRRGGRGTLRPYRCYFAQRARSVSGRSLRRSTCRTPGLLCPSPARNTLRAPAQEKEDGKEHDDVRCACPYPRRGLGPARRGSCRRRVVSARLPDPPRRDPAAPGRACRSGEGSKGLAGAVERLRPVRFRGKGAGRRAGPAARTGEPPIGEGASSP